ncbi:MAG: VIT domain-containing protein [Bacteroidota bacterium]
MISLRHILLLLGLSLVIGRAFAQEEMDKSLSPYFFVYSDNPETDALPLKSTHADVSIAGVIADVTVSQVYKNEGSNALECKYVFPASTKAAVYGLKMTIGDRTIIAEIREKNQARQEYQQAKQQGKRASLLEQSRPNVFEMNVANIMPGDVIKVELQYTEHLVPTDGVYQFVYPTVVGPRYSNQLLASAAPQDRFVASPYQKAGTLPSYESGISIDIHAGMPIQNIQVATHNTNISYPATHSATIELDESETHGGNRDYVLEYSLKGKEIESGLLLYEGEKENFFLMTVQPPKTVEPKHIPPREYIFIVDISGSMRGFPLNISKTLLRNLILNLRPTDRFNVMLFAGSSQVLSPQSLPATEENVDLAVGMINRRQGGGGTQLLPAMREALALPRTEGLSRSMVIVTDGYVSCEPEAFDLVRNNLNKSNLFPFGVGSSVNRHLIDGLANVGMGEPLIILSPEGAEEKAEAYRQYINSPVLTQVEVDFKGFDAYDVEPLTVPDVLANRPVVIFGKYRGEASGSISIKGYAGGRKKYKRTFEVADESSSNANSALRYLWARKRIQRLDDYQKLDPNGVGQEVAKEVTQLGLDYNLLTQYTSFVAIDDQVVNKGGELQAVAQPLPIPQGVENSAVGFDLAIGGVSNSRKKSISKPKTRLNIRYEANTFTFTNRIEQAELLKIEIERQVSILPVIHTAAAKVRFRLTKDGKLQVLGISGRHLSEKETTELKTVIESWSFSHLGIQASIEGAFTIYLKPAK